MSLTGSISDAVGDLIGGVSSVLKGASGAVIKTSASLGKEVVSVAKDINGKIISPIVKTAAQIKADATDAAVSAFRKSTTVTKDYANYVAKQTNSSVIAKAAKIAVSPTRVAGEGVNSLIDYGNRASKYAGQAIVSAPQSAGRIASKTAETVTNNATNIALAAVNPTAAAALVTAKTGEQTGVITAREADYIKTVSPVSSVAIENDTLRNETLGAYGAAALAAVAIGTVGVAAAAKAAAPVVLPAAAKALSGSKGADAVAAGGEQPVTIMEMTPGVSPGAQLVIAAVVGFVVILALRKGKG